MLTDTGYSSDYIFYIQCYIYIYIDIFQCCAFIIFVIKFFQYSKSAKELKC